jgi:hypothetical protein
LQKEFVVFLGYFEHCWIKTLSDSSYLNNELSLKPSREF